jgi:hypothetical protein
VPSLPDGSILIDTAGLRQIVAAGASAYHASLVAGDSVQAADAARERALKLVVAYLMGMKT